MIIKSLVAAALVLAGVAPAAAGETDLRRQIVQQDGWVSWQVPMIAGAGRVCCCDWNRVDPSGGPPCDLDARNWNIGGRDVASVAGGTDTLSVYAHVAHGAIDKLRSYSSTCSVRDAERVRRIDGVAAADSVALLAAAAEKANDALAEMELATLALHADASATPALARLADASHPHKLREKALFWLGQERGADGAAIVQKAATSDPDPDLRTHAVFVLSEAHGVDGYAIIHRIAQNDTSDRVREQALFWMAQTHDKRARDDILAAIRSDRSENVREQAVFALSQLGEDEAGPALIALVKGDYPRDVKEKALFWLGQSGSDEALAFIDEVLSKPQPKATERR
jgi:HEAT repeat protein